METGSIVSWDKKEGDRLNEGDLLAEIETDKATMAFETPEEGFLAKILVPAGSKGVPLGQPLCVIVENEDDVAKYKNFTIEQAIEAAGGGSGDAPDSQATTSPSSLPPPPPPTPQTQAPPPMQSSPQPTMQPSALPHHSQDRIFASPLAKRLAKDMGLGLPSMGSGPNGRVVANDLKGSSVTGGIGSSSAASIGGVSAGEDFVDIPLTGMRQTIAKRLTQSKQEIPHYYLSVDLEVDELLGLRQTLNSSLASENIKLSINDFIIKAAALACKKIPQVNSQWQGTFIRQFNKVDVCFAVSTDSGLITPIIFGAENKGVQSIGMESKALAEKARQSKLQPHEFQGGTFTISNLGMLNIDVFAAVINPPQSAILAVGALKKVLKPAEATEQKFAVKNTMSFCLSCDHRVVDGAVGAQWLKCFRGLVERPFTMLL